jgi:hypothetical protein
LKLGLSLARREMEENQALLLSMIKEDKAKASREEKEKMKIKKIRK